MSETRNVALITGGSRGIGLGIAKALAADGYDLAVGGVRPEREVAAVLKELRSHGREAIYCRGDVGVAADRQQILARVREAFGRLNVLVNNAGITSIGRADLLEADEAAFDRLMAVNLKGPYFLSQAVANWMIEQRAAAPEMSACLINISSISAEFVSTNRGDYCLAKAALGMLTRLFAVRLAEHDIPVYEIQPGIIASDMTAPVQEKYDKLLAEGLTLQRRWGQPEDVGRAAAALARGDIPYATGQVLKIDGGMTIHSL